MALELLIQERGGPTRTQVLPKEVAFFGRREDNDVVLPYSFVSSRHGRVFRRDGSVFVEDMGSTNGILVNGEPVTPMVPRALRPDDHIEVEKIVIQARWIEELEEPEPDVLATYHEAMAAAAAAPIASVAAPVASAPVGAPLPLPRTEAPTTMWELQAGAGALSPAASPETIRYAAPVEVGGGTVRLAPAPLSEVLASGRMQQRQAEETDAFAMWELFFKGLGLITMLAGLVLLVVVLVA